MEPKDSFSGLIRSCCKKPAGHTGQHLDKIEEKAPELPPRGEDTDDDEDDLSRNISQVMSLPGRNNNMPNLRGRGNSQQSMNFHQTTSSIDTE